MFMGLDWCVKDKMIEDQSANLMFADAQLAKLNKERNEAFTAFCEQKGAEVPSIYPNPITEEWFETEKAKELLSKVKSWELARSVCVISPMQTVGAPQIGSSEKADAWARKYYNGISEGGGKEALLEKYPTVEDYILANQGLYVAELAEKQEGLIGPSGICVGMESFRGKCLSFVDWLDDSLKNEAYEDHTPSELLDYGGRLQEAAESFEAALPEGCDEAVSEDIDVIKQAATWCAFWGSEGHAMSAWF
jgi:hypothetical protein